MHPPEGKSESSAFLRALIPPLHAALLDIVRLRPAGASQQEAESLAPVLTIAKAAIGISRISLWRFTADRRAIELVAIIGVDGRLGSDPARLESTQFPEYFKAIQHSRVISAEDAAQHRATREFAATYLPQTGITSMLDAPVFADGQICGVVCFEHIGPARRFTREDEHFAVSVADLLMIRRQQWEHARQLQELGERRELLAAARRSEDLHWLVSGVVHDFKNLVQVVSGNLEMAESRTTGPVHARLVKAQQALEQVGSLLARLQSYGNRRVPERVLLDLGELVASLGPLLAVVGGDLAKVTVEVRSSGRILGDRTQVEQVLLNLVGNARDASPQGGGIEVVVERQARGLVLTVADHGVGMVAHVSEHLFEPFFTTKPHGRGTGLGLATVKRIVETLGGSIEVVSAPGAGSTFTVVLPVAERVPQVAGGT